MRDFIPTRIHGSFKLIILVLAPLVLFIGTTVWYSGATPSTFNRVAVQSSTIKENDSTLNSGFSEVHFTAESKIRLNSTKPNSNSGHVPHPVQNVDILVIVMGARGKVSSHVEEKDCKT